MNEEAVRQMQLDLETATEEILADMEGTEVGREDVAWDAAIAIAIQAERRVDAEEFLRREFGYVPESYLRFAGA